MSQVSNNRGQSPRVQLRPVVEADLPYFYSQQCDPIANSMAAMKQQAEDAFYARWERILNSTETLVRTILADQVVVGSISCFPLELQVCLGYWVDSCSWGRGIASQAASQILKLEPRRPIFAYVADSNSRSARILEKNGFVELGRRKSTETERYLACEEIIYRLA